MACSRRLRLALSILGSSRYVEQLIHSPEQRGTCPRMAAGARNCPNPVNADIRPTLGRSKNLAPWSRWAA
eukprot:7342954-Alexandrium_andersonii.AAC.3